MRFISHYHVSQSCSHYAAPQKAGTISLSLNVSGAFVGHSVLCSTELSAACKHACVCEGSHICYKHKEHSYKSRLSEDLEVLVYESEALIGRLMLRSVKWRHSGARVGTELLALKYTFHLQLTQKHMVIFSLLGTLEKKKA